MRGDMALWERPECRASVGKPEGNIHLKDLEVDARRVLRWISNRSAEHGLE
jgi:hypothetical protein